MDSILGGQQQSAPSVSPIWPFNRYTKGCSAVKGLHWLALASLPTEWILWTIDSPCKSFRRLHRFYSLLDEQIRLVPKIFDNYFSNIAFRVNPREMKFLWAYNIDWLIKYAQTTVCLRKIVLIINLQHHPFPALVAGKWYLTANGLQPSLCRQMTVLHGIGFWNRFLVGTPCILREE